MPKGPLETQFPAFISGGNGQPKAEIQSEEGSRLGIRPEPCTIARSWSACSGVALPCILQDQFPSPTPGMFIRASVRAQKVWE